MSALTRRTVLMGLASIAFLAALPAFPAFPADRPEAIVERIYASYSDTTTPQNIPYVADLAEQLSGENHPGFDFFIEAQDFDKVSAVVTLVSENDREAVVRAEVTNFGETKTVEVYFAKAGSDWKIGNVRYPVANGFDLRQSLGLSPL